jgi:antitoxin YefM
VTALASHGPDRWPRCTLHDSKHGHPAAVVISVEDLESLEETLDVMGSDALLGDIHEALAELAAADAPVLGKDEARRLIPGR